MDSRRKAGDTVRLVLAVLNIVLCGVLLCGLQRCPLIRQLITAKV